jgi:hypothetical protein
MYERGGAVEATTESQNLLLAYETIEYLNEDAHFQKEKVCRNKVVPRISIRPL